MEHITILGNTGFLACKLCKYSILPKGLDYHFQKLPHKLPKKELSYRDKWKAIAFHLFYTKNLVRFHLISVFQMESGFFYELF